MHANLCGSFSPIADGVLFPPSNPFFYKYASLCPAQILVQLSSRMVAAAIMVLVKPSRLISAPVKFTGGQSHLDSVRWLWVANLVALHIIERTFFLYTHSAMSRLNYAIWCSRLSIVPAPRGVAIGINTAGKKRCTQQKTRLIFLEGVVTWGRHSV
jgi:hypothetical protein